MSSNIHDFLIMIPTYCEEKNLPILIPRILEQINNIDLLVIDDNSPDQTEIIIRNLQKKFSNLYYIKRNSKMGVASAYVEGYNWGLKKNYSFLGQMDADLSHRVRDLKVLMNKIEFEKNIDLVIGSRWIDNGKTEGWALQRVLLSKIGNSYIRFMMNFETRDSTAGFRIYSRKILNKIPLLLLASKGFSFQIEMLINVKKNRGRILEYPITFRERQLGKSKITGKIILEALWYVTKSGLKRRLKI